MPTRVYSECRMNKLLITSATTVEEVFQHLAESSPVFIKHHTDCVGCRLARFCTLAEVTNIYKINLKDLLDEFHAIQKKQEEQNMENVRQE